MARRAATAMPTPPSPGLWLLCPLCSNWGFTQTHSRTWAGQGLKTHENNPLPFSSPRTAGCEVITALNHGTAQPLLMTHSRCCHKGHHSHAILGPAPLCQDLSTDNGKERTCTCSCPHCVPHATATTATWASLKLYKRAAPLAAPSAHLGQGGSCRDPSRGSLGSRATRQAGAG